MGWASHPWPSAPDVLCDPFLPVGPLRLRQPERHLIPGSAQRLVAKQLAKLRCVEGNPHGGTNQPPCAQRLVCVHVRMCMCVCACLCACVRACVCAELEAEHLPLGPNCQPASDHGAEPSSSSDFLSSRTVGRRGEPCWLEGSGGSANRTV